MHRSHRTRITIGLVAVVAFAVTAAWWLAPTPQTPSASEIEVRRTQLAGTNPAPSSAGPAAPPRDAEPTRPSASRVVAAAPIVDTTAAPWDERSDWKQYFDQARARCVGEARLEAASPGSIDAKAQAHLPQELEQGAAARDALVARLGSGDEDSQAAADLFAARSFHFEPMCARLDEDTCASYRQRIGHVERLATSASTSRSPRVYAWALMACRGLEAKAANCARLRAMQWAQLAPDNGWASLAAAAQAQREGATDVVEAALQRASMADDWLNPGRDLQRLITNHLPLPSQAATAAVLHDAMLIATDPALLASASQWCPAEQDPSRRALCTRLGERMLNGAANLLELAAATRIAERSRVDPELVARAKAEYDAAQAAWSASTWVPTVSAACRGIVDMQRWAVRAADVGERQAMRERAAKR